MATIGKTFSDPDKWEEAWFLSLTVEQKNLYTYLWERCDHAGVIEIVPTLWGVHLGQTVDEDFLKDFVKAINSDRERIVIVRKRLLWFVDYIRFNQQQDPDKPLSDQYSFHKHVWKRIQVRGLVEEINSRDPVLLANFVSEEESIHSKPYLSLNEELPKSTGKGLVKGEGNGKGLGEGEEPSHNSDKKETGLEFEMRSKGMLKDTPF